jgi:hypothetical protein
MMVLPDAWAPLTDCFVWHGLTMTMMKLLLLKVEQRTMMVVHKSRRRHHHHCCVDGVFAYPYGPVVRVSVNPYLVVMTMRLADAI